MKFKIDENLPIDVVDVLVAAGHDTESIYSEGLEGIPQTGGQVSGFPGIHRQ